MTSSKEFNRKMIEACLAGNDITPIIRDYMQELLTDIGTRYDMTKISLPVVAAAFKMQSDTIYSQLDEHGKKICDGIIDSFEFDVQKIRFPCGFMKEDGE